MKKKIFKQAYVSIEVVIVAAVILTAGLCGLLAFIKNAKNNNNGMLNAIDDIYTELELPIGGTGGGVGDIGGSGNTGDIGGSGDLGNLGGSDKEDETVTPEENEKQPLPVTFGDAYAIYTDSDKTLRFIRSETAPVVGEIYEELEITDVYSGIETSRYDYSLNTNSGDVPWHGTYRNSIENVIVVDYIRPIDTTGWFSLKYCSNFDVANLDLSNGPDMSYTFADAGYNASSTLFSLDLSKWDTSKVKDMSCMFWYAGRKAQTFELIGVEDWDISNANNIESMFAYSGYNATTWSFDLSKWDTSSVIDEWVIGMEWVFGYAGYNSTNFSLNVTNWDVSRVSDTGWMFYNTGCKATSFKIEGLETWTVSNVSTMSNMFDSAGKYATTWSIGNISNWDVSKVSNMYKMFYNAGLNADYTLDISAWADKVSKVSENSGFEFGVESKIISPWD